MDTQTPAKTASDIPVVADYSSRRHEWTGWHSLILKAGFAYSALALTSMGVGVIEHVDAEGGLTRLWSEFAYIYSMTVGMMIAAALLVACILAIFNRVRWLVAVCALLYAACMLTRDLSQYVVFFNIVSSFDSVAALFVLAIVAALLIQLIWLGILVSATRRQTSGRSLYLWTWTCAALAAFSLLLDTVLDLLSPLRMNDTLSSAIVEVKFNKPFELAQLALCSMLALLSIMVVSRPLRTLRTVMASAIALIVVGCYIGRWVVLHRLPFLDEFRLAAELLIICLPWGVLCIGTLQANRLRRS